MRVQEMKKASFTVEAAFLVPFVTGILLLVIGYIYFTHERAWTFSATCEAAFYAIQRREGQQTADGMLSARISQRSLENPLGIDPARYSTRVEKNAITISRTQVILPETFQTLFSDCAVVEIRRFHPVEEKRMLWLGRSMLEE